MKLPKYLLFLLTILLFSYCGKDEDDMPIDPCLGAQETTADFGFFLRRRFIGNTKDYYIAIKDTFYNDPAGTFLTFKASPGMDEYNWTIGDDPRVFQDSTVALAFDGYEGRLNVSLTTRQFEPSTLCFPEDTGVATYTRSIYMKRRVFYYEQWPINGVFRGADEDAPDSIYTVSFTDLESRRFADFPNGCDYEDGGFVRGIEIFLTTPRQFYIFPWYNRCWNPEGIARLDDEDNNILIIEYTMDSKSDPSVRVSKRFVGTRVE